MKPLDPVEILNPNRPRGGAPKVRGGGGVLGLEGEGEERRGGAAELGGERGGDAVVGGAEEAPLGAGPRELGRAQVFEFQHGELEAGLVGRRWASPRRRRRDAVVIGPAEEGRVRGVG